MKYCAKSKSVFSEEKGDRAGIPVPGPDRSNVERTNVIKSFGNGAFYDFEYHFIVYLDASGIYPDIVGDNLDIVFIGFPIATTSTFITGMLPKLWLRYENTLITFSPLSFAYFDETDRL